MMLVDLGQRVSKWELKVLIDSLDSEIKLGDLSCMGLASACESLSPVAMEKRVTEEIEKRFNAQLDSGPRTPSETEDFYMLLRIQKKVQLLQRLHNYMEEKK